MGSEPSLRYFRSTVIPKSLPRLPSAYQQPHLAVRSPSRNRLRSRSGTYRMRYGGGTLDVPLTLRLVEFPSQVLPGIGIPAIIVFQTLHKWRIYVHLSGSGPYIQISQTTATARTSHLRTKGARTHTRHTPGSHEPRTQTLRISHRGTPSSHAFKSSIAPASLSSGRFYTRHRATAHERPTLSEPAHTWYKSKADAFAPATHELQTLNVRNRTSGNPASVQNHTLSDELRTH